MIKKGTQVVVMVDCDFIAGECPDDRTWMCCDVTSDPDGDKSNKIIVRLDGRELLEAGQVLVIEMTGEKALPGDPHCMWRIVDGE